MFDAILPDTLYPTDKMDIDHHKVLVKEELLTELRKETGEAMLEEASTDFDSIAKGGGQGVKAPIKKFAEDYILKTATKKKL